MLRDAYRPQLDSLRAIAASAVLYTHFYAEGSHVGFLGVRLFFVLSGYLITGLLMAARSEAPDGRATPHILRNFYARRMLRLWPTYYLVLVVAYVLNPLHFRDSAAWHFLYGTNILFAIRNSWDPWYVAHLWSLSIEEQFYLVWPLLMLFAPNVALKPMAIAACAVAVLFRITAPMLGIDGVALDVLTPFALDALGIGALLALIERERGGFPRWLYWAGALVAIALVTDYFAGWLPRWLSETLQVVPMAALVAGASRGFRGILGRVFDLAPLRYLGRISYGIYLYHLFVLGLAVKIAVRIGHPFDYGLERTVICTAGTIAVAALSWTLIEAPANRLKRRFPLSTRASAGQETERPEPGKSYGR